MRLVDIAESTEGTFFRCLHDEKPEIPGVTALRRRWYERLKRRGLRAKVLMREDGAVLGLCQYVPIEHSHFIGRDLFAILCIWVHGYEHLVGNQQRKGYGRFILNSIEEDARGSGAKGVAA
ncbi:MAG: GNAT family N-acetyltransferase [Candidatus Brocadiia bacterium]